jgi:signal transduction histidine kinase
MDLDETSTRYSIGAAGFLFLCIFLHLLTIGLLINLLMQLNTMRQETSHLTADLTRRLSSSRDELADRLLRGVFWTGLLVVPLSLSRSMVTGWLPIYSLHLFVSAIFLPLFLFRHRLATGVKAGGVVFILFFVGVAGVLSLGLAAPALWWLMGSLFVANVLFSVPWARATMLAAVLALVGIATGYTSGALQLSVDLNTYMREPTAWATLLLGTGGFVAMVALAIAVYDKSVALAVEHSMMQWVDGLPLGVLVLNLDGQVHYGNRRLENVLGVDLVTLSKNLSIPAQLNVFDTIGGTVAGTDKPFPPGLHPLFRAMQGEESNIEDLEIMVNGEPRRFHVTGRPVRNAEGELIYSVGTFDDITERKRTEHEFQRTRERADSASQAKGQLLANMSREMRSPMDIQLNLMQLLRQTELTERQQEYLDQSEMQTRKLLATVNEVLDYAESASGKLVLVPRLFHIDLLLAELQQRLLEQIGIKPIEVKIVCDPDIPLTLYGDDARLLQILSNLSENAAKFTFTGAIKITVQLKEHDIDSVLLAFVVSDTGIGIAPGDLDRVFSGFYQAEILGVENPGGAGVGLAVADRLVRLMGSSISASSTFGQGSTFSFLLRVMLVSQEMGRPLYPDMPDHA